jgi:hypothetical protein
MVRMAVVIVWHQLSGLHDKVGRSVGKKGVVQTAAAAAVAEAVHWYTAIAVDSVFKLSQMK